jgi:hypothetical protein
VMLMILWGFIEHPIEYASAKETKSNDADTNKEEECKANNDDDSACLDSQSGDSMQLKSSTNDTNISSDSNKADGNNNNEKLKEPFLLPFP